ncbi:cytochrome c oxidase accessory protein CcoG [bacterium]|nr:cytochrome c oxidase accessory protein CcoG [bacterium]
MTTDTAPTAAGRVLPTLNEDGTRRWIKSKLSRGRFYKRRFIAAWSLIAVFIAIPFIKANGKPLILLDLPAREFTFFGVTFLPTETMLLMLFLVSVLVAVFLATALFGRVWCGWACPQTVYLEFVFRPIERLFDRIAARKSSGVKDALAAARLAAYGALSIVVAHIFLAYFVGVDRLAQWLTRSPLEHPASFLVMATTSLLMFVDFAWFREQTCVVACPYGRLQSVLLDRDSLIVGYKPARGEPRARVTDRKSHPEAAWGDCIACHACVATCPTGIDIRDGLQMECVHCTQCIDACDAIMRKIGKPEGLIAYTSKRELAGDHRHFLRPRVVVYPAILALVLGLFTASLASRRDAEVWILRGIGSPYSVLDDGRVSNQIRVKVTNNSSRDRTFAIALDEPATFVLVAPRNPLPVPARKTVQTSVFVTFPREMAPGGKREVAFRFADGDKFESTVKYELLAP